MHRSHHGKTNDGESYEKFLGKKVYDESLLFPFERFLQASFSKYHKINLATTWLTLLQSSRGMRLA